MSFTRALGIRLLTAGAALLLALPCLAGGARLIDNDGQPMRWPDGVIVYNPDAAPLGRLDNSKARQLLAEAFMIWSGAYFSDAVESGDNGWMSQSLSGTNG